MYENNLAKRKFAAMVSQYVECMKTTLERKFAAMVS
jgi:hypothetical protein